MTTTAANNSSVMGFNPTQLDGPATLGTGVIVPQFAVGSKARGANGAEYVYCKWVAGSTISLTDGELMQIDKDFAATLITTSAALKGTAVGVCRLASASNVAATYYLWLQICGQSLIQVGASCAANVVINTTATGGQLDDDATTGAKVITGCVLNAARGGTDGTAEATLVYPTVGATL